jgi:Icc protein
MRILELERTPRWTVPYRTALPRGEVGDVKLPVLYGTVDQLPEGLDALLVAGDLQGRCGGRLLGEQLALDLEARAGAEVPPLDRIGVLLAGDLYAAPRANVRGASGPVDDVWEAFATSVRWVVGVAGNHDEIDRKRMRHLQRADVLDGDLVTRDGLTIAGLGGIIGDPQKPRRRPEPRYRQALHDLLSERPDVLVLHESPRGGEGQRGRDLVTEEVSDHVPLVVSGHVYWPEPLCALTPTTTALNVDGRAVVLTRGEVPNVDLDDGRLGAG